MWKPNNYSLGKREWAPYNRAYVQAPHCSVHRWLHTANLTHEIQRAMYEIALALYRYSSDAECACILDGMAHGRSNTLEGNVSSVQKTSNKWGRAENYSDTDNLCSMPC